MTEQTKIVTGYAHGKSYRMTVVPRCNCLVEGATALAFDRMFVAAKSEGHDLWIVSGWRPMAEQERLWVERQDPQVRERKGPAARPGFSNHQSGRALDLNVGMTVADLRGGIYSPVYRWLEEHAESFGFHRTVAVEPWHWELFRLPEDRA